MTTNMADSNSCVSISHSSQDKGIATVLATSLRGRGVEVWIDHEQILLGDSIAEKIEIGLARADAILVLISKSFVDSRWCRSEYESLLTKEIESGRTYVIALRLDDSQLPILLRAKRYADLRHGITDELLDDLTQALQPAMSFTRFERLIPSAETGYHNSVLSMIIAGVLNEVPVSTLGRDTSLTNAGLLSLYRAVDALISRFQELCDELIQALVSGGIRAGHHQSVYGSAFRLGEARIGAANRKLLRIANEMREIGSNLRALFPEGSPLQHRFGELARICASISVGEDFLVVDFGAPLDLTLGENNDFPRMVDAPDHVAFLGMHESWDNSKKLEEYHRILGQLDTYRSQLRKEIARLTTAE